VKKIALYRCRRTKRITTPRTGPIRNASRQPTPTLSTLRRMNVPSVPRIAPAQ